MFKINSYLFIVHSIESINSMSLKDNDDDDDNYNNMFLDFCQKGI